MQQQRELQLLLVIEFHNPAPPFQLLRELLHHAAHLVVHECVLLDNAVNVASSDAVANLAAAAAAVETGVVGQLTRPRYEEIPQECKGRQATVPDHCTTPHPLHAAA